MMAFYKIRACYRSTARIYSAKGFSIFVRVINEFHVALVICAVLYSGGALMAQFTSSVEGTVTDPSGAAVPNATISLLNTGTGIKAIVQTNSAGYYLFPSLPAGTFSLSAAGAGFKTNEVDGLKLESGGRRTANLTLEVGNQNTVLTVKAEVASVDLSEAKVAGTIERTQLVELPIAGRNFMALVNLTAGVTGTTAANDIFQAESQASFN